MRALQVLTASEQVAEYLRAELYRGGWGGRMPGGSRLATDLRVGRDTVEAALQLLEKEGLLVPQGVGRRRRIVLPAGASTGHPLRLAILDYEPVALVPEGSRVNIITTSTNRHSTRFCIGNCSASGRA